jgi:ATP-dependent RNA helicase DeaD
MIVNGRQKLEALTTILESMTFNAIIIFVRTKVETIELSEKLAARGYASTALNGDLTQKIREQTIHKLKAGKLDMIIATDVAARGLDVERISHVINYDIPSDPEAYTHRIGRTGRAGREGEAILFVTNREKRLLNMIEKVTGKKIDRMQLPTAETINQDRIQRFKQKITDTLENEDVELFNSIIEEYQTETGRSAIEVAAALAKIAQGSEPFFVKPVKQEKNERGRNKSRSGSKENTRDRAARNDDKEKRPRQSKPDRDMERFRIEVGNEHDVKVNNIVGAIANEAGVDSQYIKNVTIYDDHSIVDLPIGMPREIFRELKKVWVVNQQLNITRLGEKNEEPKKPKKKKQNKTSAEKRKRAKGLEKRARKPKSGS